MKNIYCLLLFIGMIFKLSSQTCSEVMEFVKSESYGTTYYSFSSDAISKVTFYTIYVDFKSYYYAIVCFKNNSYGCTEYIYQVASNTKLNYSLNYNKSAGEAFWNYIEPYNDVLGCAPDF